RKHSNRQICAGKLSGGDPRLVLSRLAQHIAAPPHRLDVILAVRGAGELLAQLAHKNVNNFALRLVRTAIEVVQEHVLGQGRFFAQAQELQHLVLLAREVYAGVADLNRLGVKIDDQIAGLDYRLGVAPRAAHDGMDARHQLVLVERLGHVVVGAVAETADFVLDTGKARQNQNRRLHLGDAQRPQNFESRHVGKVQVKQNDVVVVELAEIDAFFAKVGGVGVEARGR